MVTTEKTIDMLTRDSVSIITKRYLEEEGKKYQVGDIHRCAYVNSEEGREAIATAEPEDVSATVLQFWGDTPTVVDKFPTEVPTEEAE